MLLLDQNISYRAVRPLEKYFQGILHVSKAPLSYPANDIEIWNYAKSRELVVVTFDEDFSELATIWGPPPKVIWLRMGNSGTPSIVATLISVYDEILDFMKDESAAVFEIF